MSNADNAREILAVISTTYDVRKMISTAQNLSAGPDEIDYTEIDLLIEKGID